jgi:hypothetical protein
LFRSGPRNCGQSPPKRGIEATTKAVIMKIRENIGNNSLPVCRPQNPDPRWQHYMRCESECKDFYDGYFAPKATIWDCVRTIIIPRESAGVAITISPIGLVDTSSNLGPAFIT